jgi:hypothetical protein
MNTLDQLTEDETPAPVVDEREELIAKAKLLGLKPHPSIGIDTLREKIAAHVAGVSEEAPKVELDKAELTPGQKRKQMRENALKLVRVNIICMNPAKREWDGEIIAVGNSNLETQKKFVPFNTTDGYHIPNIMYEALKARQCQVFYNERVGNVTVRKGKLIPEFNITVLPQLTKAELAELANAQAAAGVIQ